MTAEKKTSRPKNRPRLPEEKRRILLFGRTDPQTYRILEAIARTRHLHTPKGLNLGRAVDVAIEMIPAAQLRKLFLAADRAEADAAEPAE